MSKKPNTMICTFQVYVSGEPIKKFFRVANRTALWKQYNAWARKRGGIRIDDDRYMGNVAWDIPEGVAEVREVVQDRVQLPIQESRPIESYNRH